MKTLPFIFQPVRLPLFRYLNIGRGSQLNLVKVTPGKQTARYHPTSTTIPNGLDRNFAKVMKEGLPT
jgi:hypothetical protein